MQESRERLMVMEKTSAVILGQFDKTMRDKNLQNLNDT